MIRERRFRLTTTHLIDASPDEAVTKAAAVNGLVRFVEADCPKRLLTQAVYQLLTCRLGLNAQCDRRGFWHRWCATPDARAALVDAIRAAVNAYYLSPRHRTDIWDDVKALLTDRHDWSHLYAGSAGAAWLNEQSGRLHVAADEALEASERAELARLIDVYGVPGRGTP